MPTTKQRPPAVVITGSSTGIGAACALELDKKGFCVLAGVRSQSDGQRLQSQASSRLRPLLIDVTDAESIAAAAAAVSRQTGDSGLAGLVNNAGIAVGGPLELLPIEELRRQLEVNTIGTIAVTKRFLPLLRKAKGRIVNVSSISGRLASPYLGPYSASKFALEALSDSLRLELRNSGIKVSLVEPGSVDTPIWGKARADADRLVDRLADEVTPEQVALYEPDLNILRATTNRLMAHTIPIEKVVRAVAHALSAPRPKIRYTVGMQTRIAFLIARWLPDRVRDWVMRRQLGLP